jgi:hypothetical protein
VTALAVESVTDNASVAPDSDVTRNGCTECARHIPASNRKWLGASQHCRTCHADGHRACAECGKCMPGGSRLDRQYCSSTCRLKVYQWWRSPEGVARCANCHPKAWRPVQPCEGCGRGVYNHIALRPGYRRLGRGWYATGHYAEPAVRVFCSDRCARTKFNAERKAKRADREPTDCQACGERVDTRRRDSRYCTSACRQRAYRLRREEIPA